MVKIALVGCGKITMNYHLPAAIVSPHVAVEALVDLNIEGARALARRFQLNCHLTDDLAEALDRVDGILIATPNHTHFQIAQQALERNVPVLIEKPMTTTYSDALQLCELAARKDTFISVGYKTRYYPSVHLLKRLLDEGFLGDVRGFHYEYGTRGGWSPVSGYNIDPTMSGGGVLINGGTHFLDRMLHWFGEPDEFHYQDDSYGGVEANCQAEFHFRDGDRAFSGTLFVSKTVALRNAFFLDTGRYRCELGEAQTETLTLYPKDQPDLRMELGSRDADAQAELPSHHYFQKQLDEFAACIEGHAKPTVDGRFAALSVKLIEDMYKSRSQIDEPWRRLNRARQ